MPENEEITIDLLKILKALLKKLWLIALAAVICGGAAFGLTSGKNVPVYTAKAVYFVGSADSGETAASLSAWVNTCVDLVKTRSTREAVLDRSGLELSEKELGSMVTLAALGKSELFSVSVTGEDPQEAALLANTVGPVLSEKIQTINGNVRIGMIDEAQVPTAHNETDEARLAVVAAILGAFAVCVVIVALCVAEDIKAAQKKKN